MHPVLFRIGDFTFYTHGLLAVLGIILGAVLLYFMAKKRAMNTDFLFDNIIYSVLAGILGARITYFVLYRDQFQSIKEIFFLWNGGMVSYGGFILGALAFVFLLKIQKENVLKWCDLGAISLAAGLCLGRLGNVFAGEYSGILTAGRFNIHGIVPVTLFEAVVVLIIAIGLFIANRFSKFKDGIIFYLFILFYSGSRFIIDFWRDENDLFLHITLGQYVGLILFFVSGYLLFTKLLWKRKVKK